MTLSIELSSKSVIHNKGSGLKKRIAIVDAYSSSNLLADALKAYGVEVFHIQGSTK